jgi:hypothetical protein
MAYRPHHANARSYLYAKKGRNVRFFKALIPLSCIGAVAAVVLGAAASSTATPRGGWSPNARPGLRTLPAPTHVQEATGYATSGWTVQATLPEPARAGDLLVAYVAWSNTGSVSVSDSRGDGYATAVASTTWGSNYRAGILFAKNVAGGTTKVTATLSASVRFATLDVHEYANVDAVNPLDGSSAATGSQGTLDSGPITSTGAGDLLFAAGAATGTVSGTWTGFSVRSTAGGTIVEDRIARTAGTYNATAVHGSGSWIMQAAAFKGRKPHGRVPAPTPSPTTSAPPTSSAAPSPTPTVTSSPPTTSSPPPSTTSAPPSTTAAPPSSGFPNASNTGVPAGVTLHACSTTISTAGTYDACKFTGRVTIQASNVVITRSLINGPVDAGSGSQQSGLVIRDSTIDCGCPSTSDTSTPTAIMESNFTLTRVNLYNSGHGVAVKSNVTIQDSYIHGLGGNTQAHKDGIYSGDGSHVVIRHNNVECNDGSAGGCTSAIGLLTDFGDITYYTIDNNLLNTNGSFCFYGNGGPQKGYTSNHITFTNNHFGRKDNTKCGYYGAVTYFDSNAAGNVWSGNVWDDTGAGVPASY